MQICYETISLATCLKCWRYNVDQTKSHVTVKVTWDLVWSTLYRHVTLARASHQLFVGVLHVSSTFVLLFMESGLPLKSILCLPWMNWSNQKFKTKPERSLHARNTRTRYLNTIVKHVRSLRACILRPFGA